MARPRADLGGFDQLHAHGVFIPALVHGVGSSADAPLLDRRYHMLLSYLPPDQWRHHQRLNGPAATAAVRSIARFHGYFWEERDAGAPPPTAASTAPCVAPARHHLEPCTCPEVHRDHEPSTGRDVPAAQPADAPTTAGSSIDSVAVHAPGLGRFAPLRAALFPLGCWWRKALRSSVAFDALPTVFDRLCAVFEEFLVARRSLLRG